MGFHVYQKEEEKKKNRKIVNTKIPRADARAGGGPSQAPPAQYSTQPDKRHGLHPPASRV